MASVWCEIWKWGGDTKETKAVKGRLTERASGRIRNFVKMYEMTKMILTLARYFVGHVDSIDTLHGLFWPKCEPNWPNLLLNIVVVHVGLNPGVLWF